MGLETRATLESHGSAVVLAQCLFPALNFINLFLMFLRFQGGRREWSGRMDNATV